MKRWGNTTGAFADGAVLFPLLVALTQQAGMDGAMLLAIAGAAYLAAGWVFRVPMPVQPLKSIAVAALALGATGGEIALSGFLLGAVCLILSFCAADRLADAVPRHLVQGLQMALGILLMIQGLKWGFSPLLPLHSAGFVLGAAAVLWLSLRLAWPVMGWLATGGLALGVALAFDAPVRPVAAAEHVLRPEIILALLLPQLALTLTNSIVGTQDAARRYFGEAAARVRPAWLLRSIGIGNLLAAPLGGLPFCHGSGGLTAHVRGGARDWHMNLIIGTVLLGLAVVSWALAVAVIPAYPKGLMAVLLFATGVFHLTLAQPAWQQRPLRWMLVAMAVVAAATQNMLWVLGIGIACEIGRRKRRKVAV